MADARHAKPPALHPGSRHQACTSLRRPVDAAASDPVPRAISVPGTTPCSIDRTRSSTGTCKHAECIACPRIQETRPDPICSGKLIDLAPQGKVKMTGKIWLSIGYFGYMLAVGHREESRKKIDIRIENTRHKTLPLLCILVVINTAYNSATLHQCNEASSERY